MKFLIITLGLVCCALYFMQEQVPISHLPSQQQNASPKVLPVPPQIVDQWRTPALSAEVTPTRSIAAAGLVKERPPTRKFQLLELEVSGMRVVADVFAVPADQFQASMGRSIETRQGLVYFRGLAGDHPGGAPVVLDPSDQQLYPLSAVIKVHHVDPSTRTLLLSQGQQEYYYHAPMQLLYLQTDHQSLLVEYRQLRDAGHAAELEVLKESPRPR
jgi:hypothetical protein